MTLSSMFSPSKKADKEFMLEIAELVVILVRLGQIELAERYGEWYLELEQKIKLHDYTAEDLCYERVQRT